MINSDTNNNNTDRNNNNNNTLNNFIASSSLFQKPKAAVVQPEEEDEELENTSVCSSVSSLTDDEGNAAAAGDAAAITSNRHQQQKRKKKSKFTVTPRNNTASNTTSPASDAVSISFLRQQQEPAITQPTQIIQKALTGLRPGGVFFVLDYRDETAGMAANASAMPNNNKTSTESPGTEEDHARSPQSCSIAMKEIPEDLVQQWNLTMVPTNLENYYNTKLKQPTAKPAPARVSLPASRRIVRWMGIKPRQQVSPHS